jgi:hypothetical protein
MRCISQQVALVLSCALVHQRRHTCALPRLDSNTQHTRMHPHPHMHHADPRNIPFVLGVGVPRAISALLGAGSFLGLRSGMAVKCGKVENAGRDDRVAGWRRGV